MLRVIKDFEERVAEIEAYLEFVCKLDSGEPELNSSTCRGHLYSSQARDDLLRTMKASAILLLYNLMESSVSNSVEAIFDELASKGTPFDSCRMEIRKVVLANLKRHKPGSILPELKSISTDIVTKTFRKREIASGNIDAREIRVVAKKYGFATPKSAGQRLMTVKSHRNDLAHGTKSFSEVGRSFSAADILQIKDEVVEHLKAMLESVEAYISQERYLAPEYGQASAGN